MARRLALEAPPKPEIVVPAHKAPESDVQTFVLHFEPPQLIQLGLVACELMLPQWEKWLDGEIAICPDTPPGKFRAEKYEKLRRAPYECLEIIRNYLDGNVSLSEVKDIPEKITEFSGLPNSQQNKSQIGSSLGWLVHAIQSFEKERRSVDGYGEMTHCLHYGDYFGVSFSVMETAWRDKGLL